MSSSSLRIGLGLAALLFAGSAGADELFRRPASEVTADGWHQLQLDAAAQSRIAGAWLGDGRGRPVPFLRQADIALRRQRIGVTDWVSGRDDAGGLTVEFRLEASAVASEEMLLTLAVDGTSPWIARAEMARRRPGGEWVALERVAHLYEFSATERNLELRVPRDAAEWRIRLKALQGDIRRVTQIEAFFAHARGEAPERDVVAGLSRANGGWQLEVDEPLRVVAADLALEGTVAPVRAEIAVLEATGDSRPAVRRSVGSGLVWRMPGLGSAETRVRLDAPVLARRFLLTLPDGVAVSSVRLRVQEERLWFVAEAGQRYALHFGGERPVAAGNLLDLPADVWRTATPVLTLGAPEADPFGKAAARDWSQVFRRWLPWAIGLLVAIMALVALRLLRSPAK